MRAALWMRRLALAGVVLCFTVVSLGAYVRLTAAGLGCPDWPGCYGHLTPSGADPSATGISARAVPAAGASRPYQAGKAWREMIHRYAEATLTLTIILITALALSTREQRLVSVPYALTLFGIVLVQALLGMLTVTWQLKPLVVTLHLLFGMTTLALLWWLALSLPRAASASPALALAASARGAARSGVSGASGARSLVRLGLAALALQIALGGWTSSNYAAIACPDFPTCQGAWWPAADFRHAFVLWHGLNINYEGGALPTSARIAIHLTHRLGALLTTAALTLGALAVLRQQPRGAARAGAFALLGALALQLTIGIAMVEKAFPLWLATAHTAGAALLLLAALALLRTLSAVR